MYSLSTLSLLSKTGTTYATLSTTDPSQSGKTIRKDLLGHKLTISGINTKENPGYTSRRVSLRLDTAFGSLSNTLNPKGNAYVQAILGYPEDETFTAASFAPSVAALINFLLGGDTGTGTVVAHDNSVLLANLTRLMTGET